MLDRKFHFNVISVLKLSWQKNIGYAKPRPYHALSLRLEGEAQFTHGKEKYAVGKNDIIYVPKDYDYTIHSQRDESLLVIHFDIIEEFGSTIETFTPINPDVFRDLFRRIYDVWYKKSLGYEYKVDSLFSKILENIVLQEFTQTHGVMAGFFDLIDYIHSNFTDPQLTVEQFAARMNISGAYLRRLFDDNLGTSPLKYLNALRMKHATALLRSGYYTVEEVAEMSGFTDPKYFSTAYKKHMGISPISVKNGEGLKYEI